MNLSDVTTSCPIVTWDELFCTAEVLCKQSMVINNTGSVAFTTCLIKLIAKSCSTYTAVITDLLQFVVFHSLGLSLESDII